jgi:response regulator RpfG family c-di-GMP phosphodiesterase
LEFLRREPVLLFVDDEPEVLSALRRCFRHEPYRIFTAGGPGEGLAWLEKTPIDLVVTDERMPGMSGTEFLREVRDRSPKTARAILTGYPNQTVIRRGLEAGANTFLYKPWDDESLRRTVRRVLKTWPSGEASGDAAGTEFDLGGEGG